MAERYVVAQPFGDPETLGLIGGGEGGLISFRIIGPIDGVDRTLTWVKGVGFDEGIAGVAAQNVVRTRAEVCATPTGPCYEASDRPAHVAYLTGLSVFDRRARNIKMEGDALPGIMRGLANLTWIPPDAVA